MTLEEVRQSAQEARRARENGRYEVAAEFWRKTAERAQAAGYQRTASLLRLEQARDLKTASEHGAQASPARQGQGVG